MSEWPSYGVAQVGPCSVRRYMSDSEPNETWHANIHLIAAAPLLLAEVKRLRAALSECLRFAETDGTSFGTEFPIFDIIEVCERALNDEEDEEE